MDPDLLSEISAELLHIPQASLLSPGQAQAIQERAALRFGLGVPCAWWWERLRPPVKSIVYGQGDGLNVVQTSLPKGSGENFLFLTDDSPPPWICVQGPTDALVQLLRALRLVECFFLDESLNWILFDTHHNAVVGTGDALQIPNRGV